MLNLEILPKGGEPTPEPETGEVQAPAGSDLSVSQGGSQVVPAGAVGPTEGQEAEPPTDLGGEVIFIRGTCQTADQLLAYSEMLRSRKLVRRFLEITSRKADGKVRFQMKGERP